jgi:hypothetical protein
MSDRIHFVSTKFEDLTTGEVSWGYRLYDSYSSAYCNLMTEPEVKFMTPKTAIEIIHAFHVDDDFSRAIQEYGFLFNDTYIDAEVCAQLL